MTLDFAAFFSTVAKAAGFTDPASFEGGLRSWSPTHVVIDLNMPKVDGAEVLQILRQARSEAKIMFAAGLRGISWRR